MPRSSGFTPISASLLNLFHIMALYQEDSRPNPKGFAHAAPYLHLRRQSRPELRIRQADHRTDLAVAKVVNNDPEVNPFMKIVFVENYGVTLAEKIIPASMSPSRSRPRAKKRAAPAT
jgi:starch phosphorylase